MAIRQASSPSDAAPRTANADGVTGYRWARGGRRLRSGLKKRLIVLAARNYAISYPSQITAKYGTDGLRPISLSPCLTNQSTHHCEQHLKHSDLTPRIRMIGAFLRAPCLRFYSDNLPLI